MKNEQKDPINVLTFPSSISMPTPKAWGITRMSEKMMAASRSNLFNGCNKININMRVWIEQKIKSKKNREEKTIA